MPSCSVEWCRNNSTIHKKGHGITYHEFPVREMSRKRWINAVRITRNDPLWQPSKYSVICSVHFTKEDLYLTQTGRCKITETGYPKILENPDKNKNTKNVSNESTVETTSVPVTVPQPSPTTPVEIICEPNMDLDQMLPENETPKPSKAHNTKPPVTASSASTSRIEIKKEPGVKEDPQSSEPSTSYKLVPPSGSSATALQVKIKVQRNVDAETDLPEPKKPRQPSNSSKKKVVRKQKLKYVHSSSYDSMAALTSQESQQSETTENMKQELELAYLRERVRYLENDLKGKARKIKTLNQKNWRLKNLKKHVLDADFYNSLNWNMTLIDLISILNTEKTEKGVKCSPPVKRFCLNLYNFSPQSYEYVRDTFNQCLPHPNTVLKWREKITIKDGNMLSDDAFEALDTNSEESEQDCP